MRKAKILIIPLIILLLNGRCTSKKQKHQKSITTTQNKIPSSIKNEIEEKTSEGAKKNKPVEKLSFVLNDKNAIPFFFNYQKENPEKKCVLPQVLDQLISGYSMIPHITEQILFT